MLTLDLRVPYPLESTSNVSSKQQVHSICMFLQILEFITGYSCLIKPHFSHYVTELFCSQCNYSNNSDLVFISCPLVFLRQTLDCFTNKIISKYRTTFVNVER